MFFSKEKSKGQGALEYLLIIGGALVVAVTVIVLVVSMSGSNRDKAAAQDEALSQVIDNTITPPIVNIIDCTTTQVRFTLNSSDTVFSYVVNGGTPTTVPGAVNGVYTISGISPAVTSGNRHTLTVATVKGTKMSAFSKPASTCRVP